MNPLLVEFVMGMMVLSGLMMVAAAGTILMYRRSVTRFDAMGIILLVCGGGFATGLGILAL